MGGHGGLNILPQKKWNVYRKDRQFKVNYDENKLIKEEEKKVRKKNEQAFENTISQLKRNAHQGTTHQSNAFQNNSQSEQNNQCQHINLFAEEEKEINERNKKHEEFLIKKGHYIYNDKNFNGENCIYDKTSNAKIVSDFDKIKLSQNQWYLRRQSSIFLNRSEPKELKVGNRDDDPSCDEVHQRETDHLRRSDSSESNTHRHGKKYKHRSSKRNKEKEEKKKKYDHIKKLIKYKKDKEKKERKKKRKK
ncbi:conserved Plasmodium protein, unknown function [Plasmodium knowlesi strain H]|uniref:CBF1-interacting co-repressor CIR N-terminal domain-containing protein n=3 Tax=Plasmodium knowlesi TaxID=5850 RepID=A0A5K1UJT5_PLAKH|nr:conserved protein, unknown function [Plasmodium knowlesi strain H]OTN65838.1 Uncharacterized protein PKNOH_S100056100 [Plasmodium knowlesi]CAA9987918.1 conserved protein, unknown function [Plasmodium knowlesi strain H]SBO22237.1 conserved Plasmodium protein, unknown function [Plasmodium knowlesi strain H]SBO28851.1 conserved Plasmodium protein, unknown function [Plasmodium knowlesi strain H]VVS77392.1 conserved protein, unknown function [Plasmodium knowlesi strain H]|eukprot:XP_002258900.1 hypothetical protein, conserved in Plasmodium species [Plasmodium knowlesi strain H]